MTEPRTNHEVTSSLGLRQTPRPLTRLEDDPIDAPPARYSSAVTTVFKPSHDTIQARAWQYSSPVTTLFKRGHDSIQTQS